MPSHEEYQGYDRLDDPKNLYEPKRYRVRYRCLRCGHEYQRIVASLNAKDPPCPKKACKELAVEEEVERRLANREAMLESGQAPGVIGDKLIVKAVDATAGQVMQDYGMTDLKDNLRVGDTMAPKLPGPLQQQADNFFNGGSLSARRVNALGKRALAGAYRSTAVGPGDVFPGSRGASPLHHVRSEKLK